MTPLTEEGAKRLKRGVKLRVIDARGKQYIRNEDKVTYLSYNIFDGTVKIVYKDGRPMSYFMWRFATPRKNWMDTWLQHGDD